MGLDPTVDPMGVCARGRTACGRMVRGGWCVGGWSVGGCSVILTIVDVKKILHPSMSALQ